jgi:hypothetical protein
VPTFARASFASRLRPSLPMLGGLVVEQRVRFDDRARCKLGDWLISIL